MKILHTADWHIGNKPGPTKDNINLRYMDTINAINDMILQAKDIEPDAILISGDVFDKSKLWGDQTIKETAAMLDILGQLQKIAPVVLLFGTENHDSKSIFGHLQELMVDTEEMFSYPVYIMTKPDGIIVDTKSGPLFVAGVPGIDRRRIREIEQYKGLDKEAENLALTDLVGNLVNGLSQKIPEGMPSVLMGHYTVSGCLTERDHIFTRSDVMMPKAAIEGSGFDLVCLGHIHKAQSVQGFIKPVFYSGNINTLNFNEEGDEKGFFTHSIGSDQYRNVISKFHTVKHREFVTIKPESEYLNILANDDAGPFEDVQNKIVRVLYSCSAEQEKSLSKKDIERKIMDAGAFWVQEIRPEKITQDINHQGIENSMDIRKNLWDYLQKPELGLDLTDIKRITDMAEVLIATAEASQVELTASGTFVPISLSVKNYRAYKEQFFDFTDVSSAIITGANGLGKSSFFMDAIVDCLFEETRSGDLTSWISNRPDAKSGSMEFTFKIGDIVYQVTRTRVKSGSTTLALKYFGDGAWHDISAGKKTETQTKIEKTIGMTAQTFKACMLIMQDQYGLILDADMSERMAILIDLLGLSIYDELHKLAKEERLVNKRKINERLDYRDHLSGKVNQLGELKESVEIHKKWLKEKLDKETVFQKDLNTMDIEKQNYDANVAKSNQLREEKHDLVKQYNELLLTVDRKKKELAEKESFTASEESNNRIIEAIELERANMKMLKDIPVLYTQAKGAMDVLIKTSNDTNNAIDKLQNEIKTFKSELESQSSIKFSATDQEVLEEKERRLEAVDKVKALYDEVHTKHYELEKVVIEAKARIHQKKVALDAEYESCKGKVAIMQDSNCIDIDNAKCRFLKDAKEALERMGAIDAERCIETEDHIIVAVDGRQLATYRAELANLAIKVMSVADRAAFVKGIEDLKQRKHQYEMVSVKVNAAKESIEQKTAEIAKLENQLEDNNSQIESQGIALSEYKEKLDSYQTSERFIELNSHALETQKIIEQSKNDIKVINAELKGFESQQASIDTQITAKQREIDEYGTVRLSENFVGRYNSLKNDLESIKKSIADVNMNIGAIKGKIEEYEVAEKELVELNKDINRLAAKVNDFEILQKSFHQDGIPYQIIRIISKKIQDKTNKWLGNLTGGKMSIDIKLDKVLKSNKAKEVATMDIIINDYIKGVLPYSDKSGGEKVRVALAFSVALAEIKADEVGIRSGFFGIDEPPFLDSQGVEAYCDILDMLAAKHPDMKILAISHDPEMKARFDQVIEVTADEDGFSQATLL